MEFDSLAVAGSNPAKASALKHVAAPLAIRCAVRIVIAVDEIGPTFADNARRKAVAASRAMPCALALASDGGLEIPALGARWDPLRTARFAGDVSPREKARRLLELTRDLSGYEREARWTEALAIAHDAHVLAVWVEHGPRSSVSTTLPSRIGAFWVDALLERVDLAPTHWDLLAARFEQWCRAERVTPSIPPPTGALRAIGSS